MKLLKYIVFNTISWFLGTLIIIINAHRMMPTPVVWFSVIVNVLLLSLTSWYPWLCLYWYTFSWLLFQLSDRYKDLYTIQIDLADSLLN